MTDWNKINRYHYDSPKGVVKWAWKGRWAAFAMYKGKPEPYGPLFMSKKDAMVWCEVRGQ